MAKRLKSIFTDDMDHCMFTGYAPVERHHIFEGRQGYKKKSEKYGFIAPLRPDLHPNGSQAGPHAKEVDIYLKQSAQRYYEEHIGTREQFRQEFEKSYL